MKRSVLTVLALLGLAAGAQATAPHTAATDLQLEPVSSIPALGGLHSWRAVDNQRLIVWATPFQPYLVELSMPSHDLRFARAIGVDAFGSRIHARFDAIEVAGMRYPISRIYKMDRAQARQRQLSW